MFVEERHQKILHLLQENEKSKSQGAKQTI